MKKFIEDIFKLNIKKTIIYLCLVFILYFIPPILPKDSILLVFAMIVSSIIIEFFIIAIIYTLAFYLLRAKPEKGFNKFVIRIFFAIILVPTLLGVPIDFFRVSAGIIYPNSFYATEAGHIFSRGAMFLAAVIWFFAIFPFVLKKVHDKKQKKSLVAVLIITVLLYLFLYNFNII